MGTVLGIDDEPSVRDVAAAIIRRNGMTAMTASDGTEGIAAFGDAPARIDLILLDLTMPRLDGFETFEQLRAIDPAVPVVLMSGYSEQEAGARFVGRGLAGFLQKPFTAADLSAVLERSRSGDAAG